MTDMERDALIRALDDYIDAHQDEIVGLRRWLHQHPELSGQEFQTSAHLADFLSRRGISVRLGPDRRGLLAEPANTDASHPRIAIRADIDALPVREGTGADYRSLHEGIMHACGHDAHSAIVAGSCLALHSLTEKSKCSQALPWRGIFQPAEESNTGALEMISAGALENVAAIVALHMDPSRDTGKIGYREGPLTAACDEVHIRVEGRGGHGARPHECLDPIAVAAQLISSIYLFVPRAIDSQDPAVVNICHIKGGENANVIPAEVCLEGTLRTLNERVRRQSKEHIQQLARGLAQASGAKIDVRFALGPPAVENEKRITKLLFDVGRDLLGDGNVEEVERPSMGGEDFANYLAHVSGAMIRLGCRAPGKQQTTHLHSPSFDIDENSLLIGAKILSRAVVHWSFSRQVL